MQKLYTEADMRKAFLAGATHNISFADYIKKKKGKFGIFKTKMHDILMTHLSGRCLLWVDPKDSVIKTIIQEFYSDLTK